MITFAWVTALALLALALAFWLWTHHQITVVHRQEPFLRASDDAQLPEDPPQLSVVIPAHNEGNNLRRTLDTLLVQDYPRFEVIVASDRSTDDTSSIAREYAARDARVRLFENHETPEGWAGKTWVLQQASREAKGELLLFLDADIALDPGALSVMVGYFLRSRLHLLSLYFRHEGSSAVEEIVHLLIGVVVQLRYRIKKVNDPASPVAMANGQDILVRAETYSEIGQHETFKGRVQEDLLLARILKSHGRRTELAYGFDMGVARWYPSFGAMWNGWARNVYGLTEGRLWPLLAGLALILDVVLLPYAALLVSAGVALAVGASPWTVAILAVSLADIVIGLWFYERLLRETRGKPCRLWLLPLASVIFLALLVTNVFRRVTRRRLVWRGRRYRSEPDGLHVHDE